MDASNLKHRISFVSVSADTDPETDAPIDTVLVSDIWANVSWKAVSEAMQSDKGQRIFSPHPSFTVRKNFMTQTIGASDVIIFEGARYAILSIVEIYRDYLTFEAEKIIA